MKNLVAAAALIAAFTASASAQTAAPALTPGHLSTAIVPTHYAITVTPDPDHMTLAGEVKIDLQIAQPTNQIVLNALDMAFDHVDLDGQSAPPPPHRGRGRAHGPMRLAEPQVAFDEHAQTATISFGHTIAPGAHTLTIAYHGHIYRAAQGMFAVDYDAHGHQERALYTQFEASDARRFVPSFDEPLLKAVFQINVVAPANRMVISNMPEAASDPLPGGMKRVHFQETPRMSSYLMFVGVGDFERIHQNVDGVDVGVIVKRGDTESGRFALDAASQILPYYNEYFGTPYPLPKMDLIAGPGGGGFGAMENWGAIFYFENALLVNPAITSEANRQGVFGTIAHEMAHQWFGDLVTMAWWDDIWLNEGFATWMASHAEDHFHPAWNPWLRAQAGRQGAMAQDARGTSHPIVQRIDTVDQANQAFDNITYRKGAAVIRMIETYVGPDNFRAGVRAYMQAHNHANARTADLWDAIEHASSMPMRQMADEFTHQPGVPLITVDPGPCHINAREITLHQGRFGTDDGARAPEHWHVPVAIESVGGRAGRAGGATDNNGTARLSLAGCGPFIVNPDQTGYYRVSYPRPAFQQLVSSFGRLDSIDQYGLLSDTLALGGTDLASYADSFDLATRTPATADPAVWELIAGNLDATSTLYRGRPNEEAYRTFARHLLNQEFARIGWDKKPGEADTVAVLRERLIDALGDLGDPAVAAEAQRRYAAGQLPGSLRNVTLNVVGANADAAAFADLLQHAKTDTGTLTKVSYYMALAHARDPALAQQALDHAFDPDTTAAIGPRMIRTVSIKHPEMAWRFAAAHQAELTARLDPLQRVEFMPSLLDTANDPALLAELRHYIDTQVPADVRSDPEQAYLALQQRLAVRQTKLPQLDTWLDDHE